MQSHGLPPRLINSSGTQYIQKTYYITNHKREAIEKLLGKPERGARD